jgi:hypothetical protein
MGYSFLPIYLFSVCQHNISAQTSSVTSSQIITTPAGSPSHEKLTAWQFVSCGSSALLTVGNKKASNPAKAKE